MNNSLFSFSLKGFIFVVIFLLSFTFENTFVMLQSIPLNKSFDIFARGISKHIFTYILCGILIICIPPVFQKIILTINTIINIFIYTYVHFIHTCPSVTEITETLRATKNSYSLLSYLKFDVILLFACFLIVSLYLLRIINNNNPLFKKNFVVFCLTIMMYVMFYTSYSVYKKIPLIGIADEWSIENNILRRGYIPIWFFEILNPPKWKGEVTCSKNAVAGIPLFDVSTKIVFIQVESLDYDMIWKKVGSTEVMPFLTSLADRGFIFKVNGKKIVYTSNSDYEFLNTRVATPPFIAYNVVSDYPDSIPLYFKNKNYDVRLYHNVIEENRRLACSRMGFDNIYMPKEMNYFGYVEKYSPSMKHIWDEDMFHFIEKQTPKHENFFHVIITMTMHDPLSEMNNDIFAEGEFPTFFSTAHRTDLALKKYISSLPTGTTVIIAGDHVPHHGIKSGYTPFIIATVNTDKINHKIIPGIFSRCEMSQYMRTIFAMPDVSDAILQCD